MNTLEAMAERHTVRQYTDQKIPAEIIRRLTVKLDKSNEKHNLNMRLVTENTAAYGLSMKLMQAKGIRNYIVLSGKNKPGVEEKLGYCGAEIMLYAQTLGLNSWWVGGTYRKRKVKKYAGVSKAEKMTGILVIGYGALENPPHTSKRADEISRYHGEAPEWFIKGVETVLLAPTALNKQAFRIIGDESKVAMTYQKGMFSGANLGIGKYYFEVGAGKQNFEWDE